MVASLAEIKGYTLYTVDGKSGGLLDLLASDQSWKARHIVVDTGSWFFKRKVVFDPNLLRDIDVKSRTLTVNLTLRQIEECDNLSTYPPVSYQRRKAKEQFYGWVPIWPQAGITGSPGRKRGVPPPPLGDRSLRSLTVLQKYSFHSLEGPLGQIADWILSDDLQRLHFLVLELGGWGDKRRRLVSMDRMMSASWEDQHILSTLTAEAIESGPAYHGLENLDEAVIERLLSNKDGAQ